MAKVLPYKRVDVEVSGWGIFCPGCKCAHVFNTVPDPARPERPVWTFNGNQEKPTFKNSMLVFGISPEGDQRSHCHSWVTDGKITFLADSHGHSLRGEHPLPDFPPEYRA